jgi:PPK2 family polyphosphate:nucleotide phosphotransferase
MARDITDALRIAPGGPADLAQRDPGDRLGLTDKEAGLAHLAELVSRIGALQYRLAAEGRRSLLLVLQGLDASGKDGTVRHILTGVSPQAWRIVSFKQPTLTELSHDYLWRVHAACPAHGEVGIFNRSHYEDLVTARVRGLVPPQVLKKRPRQVRDFERMLTEEGTAIIKVFLHVSADEQRERLEERLTDPEKAWKFSAADLEDRARRAAYLDAYEKVISETSTSFAPWYVVPSDHNWVRNLAVAELLAHALMKLDPQLPPADPALASLHIT